ncbi:MAG: type II secretion system F family protein [Actinobacteria bacterium]|nr:type II secretion system F family protein [Actinomycetota bacterium]
MLSALLLWVGTTLVLSELRWFSRAPLAERLRPYSPGGLAGRERTGLLSMESFREVIGPLSRSLGERLAHAFGVNEDLSVRLTRIHSRLDSTSFRVRQVGRMTIAFGLGGLILVAVRPPPLVGLLVLVGAPLLAFLLLEQQVASASAAWQRRLFLELPVLAEQLAMLLSAGFSLGSALNRLASRGSGACAQDLRKVCGRIRQGLSEVESLREWSAVAGVRSLDRLVAVLALNREASDLGRLISEEARAIRRDVQRELVQTLERRAQKVWIPVTVATLVPGVIFLAIPFIEALRLFSGS